MNSVRDKIDSLYKKVADRLDSYSKSRGRFVDHIVSEMENHLGEMRLLPEEMAKRLKDRNTFYRVLNHILSKFDSTIPQDGDVYGIELELVIKRSIDSLTPEQNLPNIFDYQLECYAMLLALSPNESERQTRWANFQTFIRQAPQNPAPKSLYALTWYDTSLLEEVIKGNNLYLLKDFAENLVKEFSAKPIDNSTMIRVLNNALKLALGKIETHSGSKQEINSLIDAILLLQKRTPELTLDIDVLSSVLAYKINDEQEVDLELWDRVKLNLALLSDNTRAKLLLGASEQHKMNIVETFIQSEEDYLGNDLTVLLPTLLYVATANRAELTQILLAKKPRLGMDKAYADVFNNALNKGRYISAAHLWLNSQKVDQSVNTLFADIFTNYLLIHLQNQQNTTMDKRLVSLLNNFLMHATELQKELVFKAACKFEQWQLVEHLGAKYPQVIRDLDFEAVAKAPVKTKDDLLTIYLKNLLRENHYLRPTRSSSPLSLTPINSSDTAKEEYARLIASTASQTSLHNFTSKPDASMFTTSSILEDSAVRVVLELADLQRLTKDDFKRIISNNLVYKNSSHRSVPEGSEPAGEILDLFATAHSIAQRLNPRDRWDKAIALENLILANLPSIRRKVRASELQINEQASEPQPLLDKLASALWMFMHPIRIESMSLDITEINKNLNYVIQNLNASTAPEISSRFASRHCPNNHALQLHIQPEIERVLLQYQRNNSHFRYTNIPYPETLLQKIQTTLSALKDSSQHIIKDVSHSPNQALRAASTPPLRASVNVENTSISRPPTAISMSASRRSTISGGNMSFFPVPSFFALKEELARAIEDARKAFNQVCPANAPSQRFKLGNRGARFSAKAETSHRRSESNFEQVFPVILCALNDSTWSKEIKALDKYWRQRMIDTPALSFNSMIHQFIGEQNGMHCLFVEQVIIPLASEINGPQKINAEVVMNVIKRVPEKEYPFLDGDFEGARPV